MAGQAAMLGLASFITANPPAAPLSSLTTPDTPSLMPPSYSQTCLDLQDLGRS